jgi:hypothetical protein
MAVSNPSGAKPAKTFSLEFGCDDGRASALSSVIYNGILARGGARSFRQGRLVLSVQIYTPTDSKAGGGGASRKSAPKSAAKSATKSSRKSAKKTGASRGR